MRYVIALLLLTACAEPHQGHNFHVQGITNYARSIDHTADFDTLDEWNGVLRRSPVIEGKGKPTLAMIKAVNDKINSKPYLANKGWLTLEEFNKADGVDCKSSAITKYYLLRHVGFKADQLNLWSGDYDGHSHMILVAKLGDKQYVLDIGAESNLPEAGDYFYKHFQPGYRFNENGWDVN